MDLNLARRKRELAIAAGQLLREVTMPQAAQPELLARHFALTGERLGCCLTRLAWGACWVTRSVRSSANSGSSKVSKRNSIGSTRSSRKLGEFEWRGQDAGGRPSSRGACKLASLPRPDVLARHVLTADC
jgi:hypothetical protein